MIPAGLDEGHERLARVGEIGDGLTHDDIQQLLRLGRSHPRLIAFSFVAGAQVGYLIVERGIDVKQRAGNIEKFAFVGGLAAIDDGAH